MGYKFIYSSDIKIYRDRRKTLFEFAKQFYRYGQGRMNQILIEGILKNMPFLYPLFLLIYLLILLFLRKSWINTSPLLIYIIMGTIDAFYLSFKNKKNLIVQLPVIYAIMHISYALGMIGGLLMYFKKPQHEKNECNQVKIVTMKSLS